MKKIIDKYLNINSTNIIELDIGTQNKTYLIDNKYIMKIFNKNTIKNKEEKTKREQKDLIAVEAKEHNITTITPIKINNNYILNEDNLYFSFYPYTNYKTINKNELTKEKIINLSKLVSKLHNINFKTKLDYQERKELTLKIDKYLNIYQQTNIDIYNLLKEKQSMLDNLIKSINNSLKKITTKEVISHNDLKNENIVWHEDIPYLLDWDACNYINPHCAINEYAYFLNLNNNTLNIENYKLFLETYYKDNILKDDIESILYLTLYGKMSWLIYSIERGTYPDEKESQKGIEGIRGIIKCFDNYLMDLKKMKIIYENLMSKNLH